MSAWDSAVVAGGRPRDRRADAVELMGLILPLRRVKGIDFRAELFYCLAVK
jgi:hypothetical protein